MAKLTARSIKKIPPPSGSGAREVPDDLMKGLVLVRHHSGAATWTVRYRTKDGQQRRLTLGKHPALSVEAARGLAAEALRAVARGEDPQAAKAAARRAEVKDSFPEMAERFIEVYARPKNRGWIEQARLLGLRLHPLARRSPQLKRRWRVIPGSAADQWQDRAVATITKREVAELVGRIKARGAPTAANRVHATLSRLFGWLCEQGVLETSPAAGTRKPSSEQSRGRVLSDPELVLVWHAAGEINYPFGPFTQMLILTGARRGEVAGMAASEVVNGTWIIPAARAKNNEEHELPLPEAALQIVAELPRKGGMLFSTTGETSVSGYSRAKRQLDAAVARLNKGKSIDPWVYHDIRRSVASGMAALGIEPHIIEAVLNHRSGTIRGVARTYNRHPYFAEKKAALERWANHFGI
jgi:integrase